MYPGLYCHPVGWENEREQTAQGCQDCTKSGTFSLPKPPASHKANVQGNICTTLMTTLGLLSLWIWLVSSQNIVLKRWNLLCIRIVLAWLIGSQHATLSLGLPRYLLEGKNQQFQLTAQWDDLCVRVIERGKKERKSGGNVIFDFREREIIAYMVSKSFLKSSSALFSCTKMSSLSTNSHSICKNNAV
jgi:hypothetical protein